MSVHKGGSAHGIMTREEILNEAIRIFKEAQYDIYLETVRAATFDFIARKRLSRPSHYSQVTRHRNKYAIIKTILDLDGFRKSHGKELLWLSWLLQANPLLVSEYSSKQPMLDDVLYMRHNVPAVNLNTLEKIILKDKKLRINAKPGSLVVRLNTLEFRKRMKEQKVKKTELARYLKVSRRMIDRYEKGECFPTPEKAEKLIQFFNTETIIKSTHPLEEESIISSSTLLTVDEFQPRSTLQREASQYLDEIGYLSSWFRSIPFDGVCWDPESPRNEDDESNLPPRNVTDVIFMGVSEDLHSQKVHKKVKIVMKMSRFAERNALWILDEDELTPAELDRLRQQCGEEDEIVILSIADLENISKYKLQQLLTRKKSKAS